MDDDISVEPYDITEWVKVVCKLQSHPDHPYGEEIGCQEVYIPRDFNAHKLLKEILDVWHLFYAAYRVRNCPCDGSMTHVTTKHVFRNHYWDSAKGDNPIVAQTTMDTNREHSRIYQVLNAGKQVDIRAYDCIQICNIECNKEDKCDCIVKADGHSYI